MVYGFPNERLAKQFVDLISTTVNAGEIVGAGQIRTSDPTIAEVETTGLSQYDTGFVRGAYLGTIGRYLDESKQARYGK